MGFHILFIHNFLNWIGDCPIVSITDTYKNSILYQLKEVFDKNNIREMFEFDSEIEDYNKLLERLNCKLSPANNVHKIGYFTEDEVKLIPGWYLDFTTNSHEPDYISKPIFGMVGIKIDYAKEITDED